MFYSSFLRRVLRLFRNNEYLRRVRIYGMYIHDQEKALFELTLTSGMLRCGMASSSATEGLAILRNSMTAGTRSMCTVT